MVKYISFYRKNRDLYVGTKDVASVAVFRSYPSITYHNSRAGLSAILVEQALIQAKIPFHLIFDEHLNDLSPATCKVLILPDSECLSDDQLALIRRFVEAGGGLIATEQAGLYDPWRRLRVKPGIAGTGRQSTCGCPLSRKGDDGAGRCGRRPPGSSLARGEWSTFRESSSMVLCRRRSRISTSAPAFWKRPKNWKELVDAVYWAAQGDVPLQVVGPDFLGANLVEQPEKQRRLVHLVNYNNKQVPSIEKIEVKCALPEGKSASAVRLYSADSEASKTLNFRMQGAKAVFTVPKLNTYSMVAVSW